MAAIYPTREERMGRNTSGAPAEALLYSYGVSQIACTVLLLDRRAAMRELVTDFLNLAGYSVVQAGRPKEAWEELRGAAESIDAVVVTIDSDDHSACSLRAQVAADPLLARIPWIVVYERPFYMLAQTLNAQAMLEAPYAPATLLDALDALHAST